MVLKGYMVWCLVLVGAACIVELHASSKIDNKELHILLKSINKGFVDGHDKVEEIHGDISPREHKIIDKVKGKSLKFVADALKQDDTEPHDHQKSKRIHKNIRWDSWFPPPPTRPHTRNTANAQYVASIVQYDD